MHVQMQGEPGAREGLRNFKLYAYTRGYERAGTRRPVCKAAHLHAKDPVYQPVDVLAGCACLYWGKRETVRPCTCVGIMWI